MCPKNSRPSVKHVLGVLEWFYIVAKKSLFVGTGLSFWSLLTPSLCLNRTHFFRISFLNSSLSYLTPTQLKDDRNPKNSKRPPPPPPPPPPHPTRPPSFWKSKNSATIFLDYAKLPQIFSENSSNQKDIYCVCVFVCLRLGGICDKKLPSDIDR